jgi:chromosomal replication initiator protein
MSLVEELHAARKARLERMSGRKVEPVKAEPVKAEPIEFELNAKPIWFSVEESPPPPNLLVNEIIRAVCRHFDITLTEIKSSRRTANVVYPRQIALCLARRHTTRSLPEIGRHFGYRDHTTVLYGARKMEGLCQTDWRVAHDVAQIEATL